MLITSLFLYHKKFYCTKTAILTGIWICEKTCGGHFRLSQTTLSVLKRIYVIDWQPSFSFMWQITLGWQEQLILVFFVVLFPLLLLILSVKNVQIDLFSIWLKTISFNLNLAALHIFPTNWMRIKWKIKESFCRNCFYQSSTIRCGQNSLKKLQVADKMLCLEF